MMKKFIAPVAALLLAACMYGCGGDASAPKQKGDPQALVGTSWNDTEKETVYKFKDAETVEATIANMPNAITGTYSIRPNGIVDISVGLQTVEAAWDGKNLTVKGKALVKQ